MADTPAELRIVADRDKLIQVVTNLLSNAVKFTPRGGTVRIDTVRRGDRIEMVVSDTGSGIAPEYHEKIFEKFQQVDASCTREAKGSGLGLPIVRTIIDAHGGSVRVESEVGKGSRFIVDLPVDRLGLMEGDDEGLHLEPASSTEVVVPPATEASGALPSAASPAQPPEPTPRPPRRILVVDDEFNIMRVMRHILESEGYVVLEASSGEEALRTVRDERPDLVLLDVLLPDLDGFEVLERLRRDADTSDVPVVILSILEAKEESFRLGAQDYFNKPIDRVKLIESVQALLGEGNENVKVLVVDDDAHIQQAITQMLAARNYQVLGARDGLEAVVRARDARPDLIILDLYMPEMDGFEVIRRLRGWDETASIPILVLTASDMALDEARALTLGAAHYLNKPFSEHELARVVRDAVSQGHPAAPRGLHAPEGPGDPPPLTAHLRRNPMPKTILVADDEPYVLRSIEYTLSRAGYRVITAVDGEAGPRPHPRRDSGTWSSWTSRCPAWMATRSASGFARSRRARTSTSSSSRPRARNPSACSPWNAGPASTSPSHTVLARCWNGYGRSWANEHPGGSKPSWPGSPHPGHAPGPGPCRPPPGRDLRGGEPSCWMRRVECATPRRDPRPTLPRPRPLADAALAGASHHGEHLLARLYLRQSVVGVLALHAPQDSERPRDEALVASLVETLESEAEARFDMDSVLGELVTRYEELSVLQDSVETIASVMDLDEVSRRILAKARDTLDVDNASLMLLDPDTGELHMQGAMGLDPRLVESIRLQPGEEISGWVASEGKPLLVEDIERPPAVPQEEPGAVHQSLAAVGAAQDQGARDGGAQREQQAEWRRLQLLRPEGADHARQPGRHLHRECPLLPHRHHRPPDPAVQLRVLPRGARSQAPAGPRARDTSLSLLMFDIDHFKNFNDKNGHELGNLALVRIARLCMENCRQKGDRIPDVVARYGGEEFMILLFGVARSFAYKTAERVRQAVQDTHFQGGENQPGGKSHHQRGRGHLPHRCLGRGRVDQRRRPGPLPRQARRSQQRPGVRRRIGPLSGGPAEVPSPPRRDARCPRSRGSRRACRPGRRLPAWRPARECPHPAGPS